MNKALAEVVASLNLTAGTKDANAAHFTGVASDGSERRIFGGHILAQALAAAQRTVDKAYVVHAMHSYFLRQGNQRIPVAYKVELVRDGRSIISRNVVASQAGKTIFEAKLSFHTPTEGLEHAATMPVAPPPASLPSEEKRTLPQFDPEGKSDGASWPIDTRFADPMSLTDLSVKPPRDLVWAKTAGTLPEDLNTQLQMFAYCSDNPIMMPAYNPHAHSAYLVDLLGMTLNHSFWIHRPFRADEWMLFEIDSDVASGSRAMSRMKVFDQSGQLVASAMQEALMRLNNQASS